MLRTTAQGCVVAHVHGSYSLRVRHHLRSARFPLFWQKAKNLPRLCVTPPQQSQHNTFSSSERYYSSNPPKPVSSSVQAVSFNQQLLIVLAIPAAALGIPFILSHPIICIALPLLVAYTPGLRAIAAPLAAQVLQLILSGLRPSGSPRSDTFPWQQANTSTAWSSPPIDVDYQALPEARPDQFQTQSAPSSRGVERQQWQDQADFASSSATYIPQQQLYRPDSTPSANDASSQHTVLQQRVPSAARSRRRTKVSIRPADKAGMGSSRVVREAQPGQVGINLKTAAVEETRSNLVRALLVVFPFLRDWGGFL